MRIAALLLTAMACTTAFGAAADTPVLPEGTVVRIQSSQIETGWHAGRIRTAASGCRMIVLGSPAAAGSESVALAALERLQRTEPVRWTEVSITALIEQEPAQCHDAAVTGLAALK